MKITRKTTLTVKTLRQFSERQTTEKEKIFCGQCAEPMISAQMSADFFGFSCRVIFRLIESGDIHFVETANNEIYVCPSSVKKAWQSLVSSERKNIT